MKKYTTALVWLRNDLRLHDHEAFTKACRDAEYVLPVYCFDPRQFGTTSYGFPKTGAFRIQFLLESLQELRSNLQGRGGNLLVRTGRPEDILPALAQNIGAQAVYYHEEATDEELTVEEALIEALSTRGMKKHSFWGATLMHIDDLPFNPEQTPDIFTQFRKAVEKHSSPRPTFATPLTITVPSTQDNTFFGDLPSVSALLSLSGGSSLENSPSKDVPSKDFPQEIPLRDARSVLPFIGGENQALERLRQYFWERDGLKEYKETRNGLLGADYSSKFSAWLALGCISPRAIYEEVKRYEKERIANDSTYWLIFELLWRDFFRFTALKYDTALFRKTGIMNVRKAWREDWEKLERWKQGTTGIPFIDANMRELALTGFMSNRGRQNVASFLVRELNVHWLMGAEWFESQLVDYDVCSNYGNWNYAAGIGNDPREDRHFNILRQAGMYDTKGEYVRHWLPELRMVPNHAIHTPHIMNSAEQKQSHCIIGKDYPDPLVRLS